MKRFVLFLMILIGGVSLIYGDSDSRWACCREPLSALHGIRLREMLKSNSRLRQKDTAEFASIVDAWLSMGAIQPKSTPLQQRFYEIFGDDAFWEEINDLQIKQSKLELELMDNLRKQWEAVYKCVVSKGELSQEEWEAVSDKLKATRTPESRKAFLRQYLMQEQKLGENRD